MRWPWSRKPEKRQSGGGYTDRIVAAIEAQATATVADVSSTAAIEAAAGALSRALMSCDVGPGWVQDAVSPVWMQQVGRSIVREGSSFPVGDRPAGRQTDPDAGCFLELRKPGATRRCRRRGLDVPGDDLRAIVEHHAPAASSAARLLAVGNITRHPVSRPRADILGEPDRPFAGLGRAQPRGRVRRTRGPASDDTRGHRHRQRRRQRPLERCPDIVEGCQRRFGVA